MKPSSIAVLRLIRVTLLSAVDSRADMEAAAATFPSLTFLQSASPISLGEYSESWDLLSLFMLLRFQVTRVHLR